MTRGGSNEYCANCWFFRPGDPARSTDSVLSLGDVNRSVGACSESPPTWTGQTFCFPLVHETRSCGRWWDGVPFDDDDGDGDGESAPSPASTPTPHLKAVA